MIPQENRNIIKKVSNEVTSSEFTISADASMFAMLTANVYTDPIKAVIREWSTNACDVCLEAGVPVKFDVHLPVAGDSTFSVRDYGTGLSPEVLTGLFTVLGASTKRNSNVTNGTLGIGRLAGLAVADTFTVESFLDGTHYSYVVSMVEGKPTILHLGDTATQEPNGLKLSVLVEAQKVQTYYETAEKVYKYFEHKPSVNLDINMELAQIGPCSDRWFITKDTRYYGVSNNHVVMAQVAYAIPDNTTIKTQGIRNMVFTVNTGDVTFNPGRETLSLDTRTINMVNSMFKAAITEATAIIQQSIALCTNDKELYTCYTAAQTALPREIFRHIQLRCLGSKQLQYLTTDTHSFLLNTSPKFFEQTDNTVKLVYKSQYYKRFKDLTDTTIGMKELFSADHVIVDIKTGFLKGLQELYNKDSVFLWKCTSNKQIEKSVAHAKKYLTAMGLTYKLVSDILPEKTTMVSSQLKAPREGVYASKITSTTISRGSRLRDAIMTTGTHLYLKLSNTTPVLKNTSITFTAYWRLYKALAQIESVPTVWGVAKKYQPYVDALDNWIDFESYVEEKIKETTFQVPSDHAAYYHNRVLNKDSVEGYPKIVQNHYENIVNYCKYMQSDNYISSEVETLAKGLGATFKPYIPLHPSEVETLENDYPLTFNIVFDICSHRQLHNLLDTSQVQHIAKLEEFYAIHSNQC